MSGTSQAVALPDGIPRLRPKPLKTVETSASCAGVRVFTTVSLVRYWPSESNWNRRQSTPAFRVRLSLTSNSP
ncbi:hypothetical protein D3C80_1199150 [compost metagenome]